MKELIHEIKLASIVKRVSTYVCVAAVDSSTQLAQPTNATDAHSPQYDAQTRPQ